MSTVSSSSSQPLFRPEVLQAQQAQWLGSIRIARPLSFALVTGVAVLLAAGLVSYGVLGEITRKTTLPGLLVPVDGLLQVTAPQASVVAEVLVNEGQQVHAGHALRTGMTLNADSYRTVGKYGNGCLPPCWLYHEVRNRICPSAQ